MSSSLLAAPPSASADSDLPRGRTLRRVARWTVALVAVAAMAVVVWEEVLEDRFVAKRWGVVVPGRVYRSGQLSEHLVERVLLEHRIGAIVDMQGIDPTSAGQAAEIEAARRHGIELARFPMAGDGTGDIRCYAEAIAMIDRCERAGTPVLVHCSAGAQRTGGVVASYRMLVRGESPAAAYAELARYDWDPETDYELVEYVNGHMAELAALLVEMGVIQQVPDPLPVLAP